MPGTMALLVVSETALYNFTVVKYILFVFLLFFLSHFVLQHVFVLFLLKLVFLLGLIFGNLIFRRGDTR